MIKEMNEKTIDSLTLNPGVVFVIMMTTAIMAPAGFNVSLDPISGWIMELSAVFMLWTLPFRLDTFQNTTAIPSPFAALGNLPITFLRFVFVYQMYKLYQGRTSRKRTMIVGVASELQMTVVGIFNAITPVFSLMGRFFIPIPILFLVALVILRDAPPPEVSTLWEHSENSESWWLESSKHEESTPQIEEGV